jgi:RNA polymerase-binding transcription factor DksA
VDDPRDLLEADRRRTVGRLADLTADYREVVAASRDTIADDEPDPEGSTIAFERSQVGALVAQARAHLDDVALALARLDAGTYDVCERCSEPIGAERLQARPVARTCMGCASR